MSWFDRILMRDQQVSGSEVSIQPQVSQFWSELRGGSNYFTPRLIDRVWVASRCIQLNSQQIASMPLEYEGPFKPAWVSSPDPVFFPNGIGDAMRAAVRSYYGWGDAFLMVTSRYATGFPQGWTVLDPSQVEVKLEGGRRTYRVGETPVAETDIVQISRDPAAGSLRGTSALRAYSAQAWSQIGAGDTSQNLQAGGTIPPLVLRPKKKATSEQAQAMQAAWVEARARYGSGVPAVMATADFDDPFLMDINAKDLALLELAEFDARVIASAFGVPSYVLNLPPTGSLLYQNPTELRELWWWSELYPTSKSFSDAFSANMLPAGQSVTFNATVPASSPTAPTMNATATVAASPNVTPLRPAQGGNA